MIYIFRYLNTVKELPLWYYSIIVYERPTFALINTSQSPDTNFTIIRFTVILFLAVHFSPEL